MGINWGQLLPISVGSTLKRTCSSEGGGGKGIVYETHQLSESCHFVWCASPKDIASPARKVKGINIYIYIYMYV